MTSDQLTLVHVEAEPKLTPRQEHALELVRQAGTAGIHSDELGAQLHAEYRKHGADDRCQWCGQTGNSILKALKKKGLVRYRRGSRGLPSYWTTTNGSQTPAPQTGDYDGAGPVPYGQFPAGF